MKNLVLLTALALVAAPVFAGGGELDPVANVSVPDALVVKIAQDGKREVYKIPATNGVIDNEAAAKIALEKNLTSTNKVQSVSPLQELDQVTSQESWHWSWVGAVLGGLSSYYRYTYNCHGSSYVYYPSYSYYYGGYQYNYYYTPTHYGYYNGGSRYSDPYGWHYSGSYGWHNSCRR